VTTVTPDRPHGIKLHKVYLYGETYGDNGDTQPVLRDCGTAVTVNTGQMKYSAKVFHRNVRGLRATCNSVYFYAETYGDNGDTHI